MSLTLTQPLLLHAQPNGSADGARYLKMDNGPILAAPAPCGASSPSLGDTLVVLKSVPADHPRVHMSFSRPQGAKLIGDVYVRQKTDEPLPFNLKRLNGGDGHFMLYTPDERLMYRV